MAKPRLLLSLEAAAAAPLAPSPKRTRIRIHWREAAAKPVEIRHRHLELAAKMCRMYSSPSGARGPDAPPALDTQDQTVFASSPRRRAT